jgi:glucose/arabinose dehydrogenase
MPALSMKPAPVSAIRRLSSVTNRSPPAVAGTNSSPGLVQNCPVPIVIEVAIPAAICGPRATAAASVTIIARDAQGNRSAPSTTVVVTTGAACASAICSVTQVATDTDVPWGLTQLPNGDVLYARRDAFDVVRLNPATGAKTSIGQVPNTQGTDGEGGIMGIAIAPTFSSDPWLYVMHTSPTDNRVVRIRYTNGVLSGSPQVLITGIARNKFHNGGRLRFGPDGRLYIATGDGQNGEWAQDTNNLAGKVLRIIAEPVPGRCAGGPPRMGLSRRRSTGHDRFTLVEQAARIRRRGWVRSCRPGDRPSLRVRRRPRLCA